MQTSSATLWPFQHEFVEAFAVSEEQRTMLVAAPGMGKTLTSVMAVRRKLRDGKCRKIVVVSEQIALQKYWQRIADANEINLDPNDYSLDGTNDGISTTHWALDRAGRSKRLTSAAERGGVLLVFDDVHRLPRPAMQLTDEILSLDSTNQALFITNTPLVGNHVGEDYDFGKEYLFEPTLIKAPETRVEIARYSPSIKLLDRVKFRESLFDDLSWRQFETLISNLLESDGYEIQLMSGTKDGGVDIVAFKDLGVLGTFKTVWQAKKIKSSRKIGIATIRELADVRQEFRASKAFIVTSSFLTAGAIRRIERDKYILGKVDRRDLAAWIHRKLHE